jgi:putative transposase
MKSRRDRHAARRLMRKLLKKHGSAPRVLITGKLRSYAAANRDLGINVEHRQHKGLNDRAENSHRPYDLTLKHVETYEYEFRFTSIQ